jgi:ribosome-binding factor A
MYEAETTAGSSMKQFKRSDRLAGQILRDISELLHYELTQAITAMVTFTRVVMSEDLRYAKIYYSVLGTEEQHEEVVTYFQHNMKTIRRQIGKNLRVRHIPELTFVFDPSVEEGLRIETLLNDIRREREKE